MQSVQMDNLMSVIDVRKKYLMRNGGIREMWYGVEKVVNEIIKKRYNIVWSCGKNNDSRLVKRMYSVEYVGNRLAERPKKRWIDSAKERLKETCEFVSIKKNGS